MGRPRATSLPTPGSLDALAALYLRAPTGSTLRAASVDPCLSVVTDDRLEDVVADYHALFFVPVSGRYVSPFESAQRGLPLGGALPLRIADLYAASGFDLRGLLFDERWGGVPRPDHVGCELAFVAALQRGAARRVGRRRAALLGTAATFWEQFPAGWIGDFGQAVAAAARTGIYRRAGRLTAELAQEDRPLFSRLR